MKQWMHGLWTESRRLRLSVPSGFPQSRQSAPCAPDGSREARRAIRNRGWQRLIAPMPMAMAALLLAAHATADPFHDRLDAAYLRDATEAVRMARAALANPHALDPNQILEARSYLCNALSDQDQFDAALAETRAAADAVPSKPAADQVEFAAQLITCVGFASKQKQQFAQAMAYFDHAIAMLGPLRPPNGHASAGSMAALSDALYRRAGLYDTLGEHAKAMSDLTLALQVLPGDPADPNLVAQRMNIASESGRILLHRQEYARAAAMYESTLDYTHKTGDTHAEAIVMLHLGECYRGLQRWDDALRAYRRALAIAVATKDLALQGRAHAGLGGLARARQDYPAALNELAQAHDQLVAAKLPLQQVGADLDRAQTLADLQRWPPLAAQADTLVAALTGIGDKRLLVRAYQLRARAAEGEGKLAAALADTRQVVALQEQIRSSELADEMAKRSAQFEVARLGDEKRLLARENDLAHLQIRHDRDIKTAQRVAIAIALLVVLALGYAIRRRIRTQRLLTRLAQEDALTGLRNRRETLAASAALFNDSRRNGTQFCVALIDLDLFKQINDDLGHAAGDAVLVALATCMRDSLRTDDICGRIGGEEFLLAFPRFDHVHATARLESIHAAVARLQIPELPPGRVVTFSAGIAWRRDGDVQIEALIRRADVALYAAKHAGRNRSVVDATAPG